MGIKSLKSTSAAVALVLSSSVNAGTITGGTYLDDVGANQLEAWLGVGDQDFTNISDLSVGASASQWHTDVSGYTNVISIYDVTYNGSSYLIGGYSAIDHDGIGYSDADTNFIFNLTIGKYAGAKTPIGGFCTTCEQYDNTHYFATFGGGHDLYAGLTTLGLYNGYTNNGLYFSTYGYSYDQGTTDFFGGTSFTTNSFNVNGLESYVYTASAVPLPAAVWLFGSGLIGLVGFARRKKA